MRKCVKALLCAFGLMGSIAREQIAPQVQGEFSKGSTAYMTTMKAAGYQETHPQTQPRSMGNELRRSSMTRVTTSYTRASWDQRRPAMAKPKDGPGVREHRAVLGDGDTGIASRLVPGYTSLAKEGTTMPSPPVPYR